MAQNPNLNTEQFPAGGADSDGEPRYLSKYSEQYAREMGYTSQADMRGEDW